MKFEKRDLRTFQGLRRLVSTLRGPEGCPWDRVQTHRSLRPFILEEACEVLEAIDEDDPKRLCEELGDLLLQVVLHTQIAEESRQFRMGDVIASIAEKLVRRHPHVFGDAVAETPEAVVEQWDDLKRRERQGLTALDGIPATLPSLAYAQAIQRRAEKAGFGFQSIHQAWDALEEEINELRAAATPEEQREEVGDLLFAAANLARCLGADAEDSLRSTCHGFASTFRTVERLAAQEGVDLQSASMETKLALWEQAKKRR